MSLKNIRGGDAMAVKDVWNWRVLPRMVPYDSCCLHLMRVHKSTPCMFWYMLVVTRCTEFITSVVGFAL